METKRSLARIPCRAVGALALLIVVLAVPGSAGSDEPPPAGGDAEETADGESAPCRSPQHRQFDFWIGDWVVEKPDGTAAGTNRVKSVLEGCAIRESWEGTGGMTGTSLNTYYDGRWHQTWVDDRGGLLVLEGSREGESMVLSGTMASRRDPDVQVRHEIRWTPIEDGRVRQVWRTSKDDGASWSTVFEGIYVSASDEEIGDH